MNIDQVPPHLRYLHAFIGIHSLLILEGNVNDHQPMFRIDGDNAQFLGMDNLDMGILSLVDEEKTAVFFLDPIRGFYNCAPTLDAQRAMMEPLFRGYSVKEESIHRGTTAALMPFAKKGCSDPVDTGQYLWASEIIRRGLEEGLEGFENVLFVVHFSGWLNGLNSRMPDANKMFLNLTEAATGDQPVQSACNTLLLVVDRAQDLPQSFSAGNPNARIITAASPDKASRQLFIRHLTGPAAAYACLADQEAGKKFLLETHDLKLKDLQMILNLAVRLKLPPEQIEQALHFYKFGYQENAWEKVDRETLAATGRLLHHRVKGQEPQLDILMNRLSMASQGLSGMEHSDNKTKPRAVLMFAGPSGTGKTETAKAVAEGVFGDEHAMTRFNMSEFKMEQGVEKLLGAPPGYVGYEAGGRLTNAVKKNAFQVLLFDEIEKAHPTIWHTFLSILEDGQITSGLGETVYFSESILIFTSNLGTTTEEVPTGRKMAAIAVEDPSREDTAQFQEYVTKTIKEEIRRYFLDIGVPEALNRIGEDNILVYQFISKTSAVEICDMKVGQICRRLQKDKGLTLHTEEANDFLHAKAAAVRADGGRGIGNMLSTVLLSGLSRFLLSRETLPQSVACRPNGEKLEFYEVIK